MFPQPQRYVHSTLESYQRDASFTRKLNDHIQEHDPNGFKCPNDNANLVNVSPLVDGVDYKCPVCGWELVEVNEGPNIQQ